MCAYRGECRRCYVVCKVTCKCCGEFCVGNNQNTQKTEQDFQYAAQKVINDANLYYFAAHFTKIFTQKPSPQQCRDIMYFEIISTVNPIGSMKTWG